MKEGARNGRQQSEVEARLMATALCGLHVEEACSRWGSRKSGERKKEGTRRRWKARRSGGRDEGKNLVDQIPARTVFSPCPAILSTTYVRIIRALLVAVHITR